MKKSGVGESGRETHWRVWGKNKRRGKDMADIKGTNTNIDGSFVVEHTIFSDNGGDLFEAYND